MNPFLYCTVGEPQRLFGVYLTGAGAEQTAPGEPYPHDYHSSDYFFTWNKGRRLVAGEYQLLYIRAGRGVIEFKRDKSIPLEAGSLVILHPDEWHRYRPDPKIGWSEAYVGIGGDHLARIFRKPFFAGPPTVLRLEPGGRFEHDLLDLIDAIRAKTADAPYSLALRTLTLVAGLIEGLHAENGRSPGFADIRRAHHFIGHHLGEVIDFEKLARDVGLGYSVFRKRFREYTGMAPLEYQIALRIRRASRLLTSTSIPIAEIAADTGFNTPNYFSRFFRKTTGLSPAEFRKSQS